MRCVEDRLVGRAAELAELRERRRAALAGHGSVLVLAGEPGIGKSSLLEVAVRDAGAEGLAIAVGRAVPDEGAPEFWPWRRILGQIPGLAPDLLDLDADAGGSFDPAPAARFRVIERVTAALIDAAAPAGLLVVFDDVQWADESSRRLLGHLAGEVRRGRMTVLCGLRTPGPDVDDLELHQIGPLSVDDVRVYLDATGAAGLGDGWPPYLHRHTAGNPLFLREVLRLLNREQRLVGDDPPERLPVELSRLMGRRLAALGPQCRTLVAAAAVIGDEVDVALLGTVLDGQTEPGLSEALRSGVLIETDAPTTIRFAHGLVRQAAYDELPRAKRVAWHARVADALPATAEPGEHARHRTAAAVDASSAQRAVAAVRMAAAAARDRHDFADAARWRELEAELQLTAGGETAERAAALIAAAEARLAGGQVIEACDLAKSALTLAESAGRTDLVADAALVVRNIGGTVSRHVIEQTQHALLTVPPPEPIQKARLLALQAAAQSDQSRADLAEPLSREAMRIAERTDDPDARIDAIQARFGLAYHPGDEHERSELSLGLRGIGERHGRTDALLWAAVWRIDLALSVGALGQADAEIATLAGIVDRVGWPLARWQLLRAQATQALLDGRLARAEELAGEFRAVAAQTQDDTAHGLYMVFMGDVWSLGGRYEPMVDSVLSIMDSVAMPVLHAQLGRQLLRVGLLDHAAIAFDRLRPRVGDLPVDGRYLSIVAATGELAAALDDADTARRCYELALPYDTALLYSTTGNAGAVARSLGTMAVAFGQRDDAVRHLTEAVALEKRAGAVPFLAVAQLELARALAARGGPGDRGQAERAAETCVQVARRIGLGPTATSATTLLAGLTGIGSGPSALTAREREIAAFVAGGDSNRAIAERLVLSERTVETHVRSILSKLGLTNRTQVAAWAQRSGLGS
jgi:DNA-binding NarL/FixJ family response regulator